MFARANSACADELSKIYSELEPQVISAFEEEGYVSDQVRIRRYADLRYTGQAYELTVPVTSEPIAASHVSETVEVFQQEHLRTYGHRAIDEPVDFVNLRVVGKAVAEEQQARNLSGAIRNGSIAYSNLPTERMAYFRPDHGSLATPVLSRYDLAGRTLQGPVIIEEYDATCVVPPPSKVSVVEWGNIVIEMGPRV